MAQGSEDNEGAGKIIRWGARREETSLRSEVKKINVLQFICPSGFYGAEMWILALAKNLEPENVNCHLAITRESEGQNIELYKRCQSLGIDSHQIKVSNRFDPRVLLKLSALIKQKHIHIIHTHGYKSDILGLIAAKMSGIKAVTTPHGFGNAKGMKLKLYLRLGDFVFKYFDIIAPLSEELKFLLIRNNVPERKIQLIRNGVDLTEIELEKRKVTENRSTKSGKKRIFYVGRLEFEKNVIDIIKTFDLLYREHKDIRLIIVGDGMEKEKLEEQTRSMSSHSKIKFLGYRSDRLELLNDCDLFSMTSSSEGIPRCMMEAMAMEIPVASYNIPGVSELIIHQRTGFMADFGNIEDLKKCWEQLLFNREFAKRIAKNGRKRIEEYYSAKRMAGEYVNLYQKMLKN